MKKLNQILDRKTLTPSQLARKHKKPIKDINRQIKKGMNVEKEHSSDSRVTKEIASDHVREDPKYYDKLKKIEK